MVATASETRVIGDVSVETAAGAVRALVEASQLRIAFAGPLGAGKTTMCELIANAGNKPRLNIFNHADGIKEEVLEWVSDARRRAYIPGEEATFDHFCNFLGISPGIVRLDMGEMLMPVWQAFNSLLEVVYDKRIDVIPFASLPPHMDVARKVAFVDLHKQAFRTSLQLWGQVTKDINADPYYWVNQTITRALGHAPCFNGDTRFLQELELLSSTGWKSIYITVSAENQNLRRPELTEAQRNHISERSIGPDDCDAVVDGDLPVPEVLLAIASYLAERKRVPQRRT